MKIVPVAELMSEDSFNFLGLTLLDQGVKDDNVLVLSESEPEKAG